MRILYFIVPVWLGWVSALQGADYYPMADTALMQTATRECRLVFKQDLLIAPSPDGSKLFRGPSVAHQTAAQLATFYPFVDVINLSERQVLLRQGSSWPISEVIHDTYITHFDRETSRALPRRIMDTIRISKMFVTGPAQAPLVINVFVVGHSDQFTIPVLVRPLNHAMKRIRPWIDFDIECLTEG